MNQPYRVIVWGGGAGYEQIINSICYEIAKGHIIVVGIVERECDIVCDKYDGFNVIVADEIKLLEYDYVIVSAAKYYREIVEKALLLGIEREKILDGSILQLPHFDFKRYVSLIENRLTILSDDCWGGYIYSYLKIKFYSPTINILWKTEDYCNFIINLNYYLKCNLVCERDGNIRNNLYPIGSLGDGKDKVFLNFVHAKSFDEAARLWIKRLDRINWNNIFIKLGLDPMNKKYDKMLGMFEKCNYKKICFSSKEDSSDLTVYLARFEKYLNHDNYVKTINYYDYIREIDWFTKSVDVLKLLNGEDEYLRE